MMLLNWGKLSLHTTFQSEAPELPEGVERDPVRKQDDFGENADVYGFVSIRLNAGSDELG